MFVSTDQAKWQSSLHMGEKKHKQPPPFPTLKKSSNLRSPNVLFLKSPPQNVEICLRCLEQVKTMFFQNGGFIVIYSNWKVKKSSSRNPHGISKLVETGDLKRTLRKTGSPTPQFWRVQSLILRDIYTRWAHSSYKWSYNPYKWPYKFGNWGYNPTYRGSNDS